MDKNLNTDFTENTDLAFSLIFLVGKCFLDFVMDLAGFASAWALPFFGGIGVVVTLQLIFSPHLASPEG